MAAGTEIGLRAKAIMDAGELVSDEVMIGIVRERLDRPDVAPGFILDGFPRTVAQAGALDALMADRPPLVVVDIQVPDAELVRRLTFRLICGACGANAPEGVAAMTGTGQESHCQRCGGTFVQRADDNEAVVRERLQVYQRNTKPLVEYYQARSTFCAIDGAQPAGRVAELIATAVDAVGRAAVGGTGR